MGSVSMMGKTAIFNVLGVLTTGASVGLAVAAWGAQAVSRRMASKMITMFRFMYGEFLS
jgi:hypothetical protein